MKYRKAPGENGVVADILKDTGEEFYKRFAQLFSKCIQKEKCLKISV